MNGREVHLGAAGIHKPRVSKVRAEKITNPFRAAQSALVSGLFVPKQQPEHHVIMAPGVPRIAPGRSGIRRVPRQSIRLRPRAEISIVRLAGDQLRDELF